MKLMPVGDRVLVRQEKTPEQIGSIVVPEVARESAREGIAIAVGPKVREVKAGDRVLLASNYSGSPLPDGEFVVVKEADILAVVGE